jgi:hypothetical protein
MLHKSISDMTYYYLTLMELILLAQQERQSASVCGTTLTRLPPRFPSTVNPVPEPSGDRTCSGSELPIANSVTGITMGTRKRCDPAFTAV